MLILICNAREEIKGILRSRLARVRSQHERARPELE